MIKEKHSIAILAFLLNQMFSEEQKNTTIQPKKNLKAYKVNTFSLQTYFKYYISYYETNYDNEL